MKKAITIVSTSKENRSIFTKKLLQQLNNYKKRKQKNIISATLNLKKENKTFEKKF